MARKTSKEAGDVHGWGRLSEIDAFEVFKRNVIRKIQEMKAAAMSLSDSESSDDGADERLNPSKESKKSNFPKLERVSTRSSASTKKKVRKVRKATPEKSVRSTLKKSTRNKFCCRKCHKQFRYRSDFLIHLNVHSAKKLFVCDECKMSFRQKSGLRCHSIRVHSKKLLYVCHLCRESFIRKGALSIHMKQHSDKKEFVCDWCKKSYKHSLALSIHTRIHTGESAYVTCEVCDKSFLKKEKLLEHNKEQHAG